MLQQGERERERDGSRATFPSPNKLADPAPPPRPAPQGWPPCIFIHIECKSREGQTSVLTSMDGVIRAGYGGHVTKLSGCEHTSAFCAQHSEQPQHSSTHVLDTILKNKTKFKEFWFSLQEFENVQTPSNRARALHGCVSRQMLRVIWILLKTLRFTSSFSSFFKIIIWPTLKVATSQHYAGSWTASVPTPSRLAVSAWRAGLGRTALGQAGLGWATSWLSAHGSLLMAECYS